MVRASGFTTAAMEAYDASAVGRREGSPGLVVLYTPGFAELPAAFPFLERDIVLGREPPATLRIPHPSVSRAHARFVDDGHGFALYDLGARNGTIVNGSFIDVVRLRHGDEIRIGDAFFKYVAADAEGYVPYRIDGAVREAPAAPSGIVGGYQVARISLALERVARSPISVVILGESGTGKEVFARQLHAWSGRRGAFCALNCAAIPSTLLESQLFGYRRGAFSGADRDHVGLVRAADGGTLFLDEIGDMPVEAQAKLLRVLQTREVLPLGATVPEQVDVRVLCATHRDLGAMQRAGTFRGDLFARLNEYSVSLPPLRARKEDIYALCESFLRRYKRPDLVMSIPYITGLLHYDYPYNVRELEALIKRGVALVQGGTLEAQHLSDEVHARMRFYGLRAQHGAPQAPPAPPQSGRPAPASAGVAEPDRSHLAQTGPVAWSGGPWAPPADPAAAAPGGHAPAPAVAEPAGVFGPGYVPSEQELRDALRRASGNVAEVGRHYGRERMQVHRWMKRYGIDPDEYR